MTNQEIKKAWNTHSSLYIAERVVYLKEWLAGYDEEYSKGYFVPSHTKEEIILEIAALRNLIFERDMLRLEALAAANNGIIEERWLANKAIDLI